MAEMDFKAASSTMEALARISVSISLFCFVFLVCVCLHWFDEIDTAAPVFHIVPLQPVFAKMETT